MHGFLHHKPERLFVTGSDCVIVPIHFTPYTVAIGFVGPECPHHPSCNPIVHDAVTAQIITLPGERKHHNKGKCNCHNRHHHSEHYCHEHNYGIKICWRVAGTREIEWKVTELTDLS